MKRNYLSVLLLLLASLFSLSAYSITIDDNLSMTTTNSKEGEIILKSDKKDVITRSLWIAPDIRAFVDNEYFKIRFNESLNENVSITITDDAGSPIYMDMLYVDSSTTYTFFLQLEESEYYYLEIAGTNWVLSGEF